MAGPRLDQLGAALTALGEQLVDLESDTTLELIRQAATAGRLVGSSATTWADAEHGLQQAWDTYRAVADLVTRAEADPATADDVLGAATVPPVGDPVSAVTAARAAADEVTALVRRFSTAWHQLAPRLADVRAGSRELGDAAAGRSADALADLLASDPLEVTENDVVAVEAMATASGSRYAAAQVAAARIDVDLVHARSTLQQLGEDADAAASELAHAVTRIAGLSDADPVPDRQALADWLENIEKAVANDPVRAAADLEAWETAAATRRGELDRARDAAQAGMRRRDLLRGQYKGLRAKAGARRVDEVRHVADALTTAEDQLWTAPCDLAQAEQALTTLARLLEHRPDAEAAETPETPDAAGQAEEAEP